MRKIEYRARNVRDTLVELKDDSELAVDLAYSAALFGNEALAREVLELEERVTFLQYNAKISLMLAAKRADDAERLVGILGIVEAAVAITEAAADVAAVVLNGGIPAEARVALPEADEVVVRAEVTEGSAFDGRRLGELAVETETGVRVVAHRRDHEWTVDPGEELRLEAGDVLVGSGPGEGVDAFHERATGESHAVEPTPDRGLPELRRAAETIVELKDTAELAVGLAYGSVLFDSEAIAREVVELEQRSDELTARLQTDVIGAGGAVEDPDSLRGLLRIATASEEICDAAHSVADVVLREGEVHPVFAQAIRESNEVIASATVAPDSDLAGATLGSVGVDERTGMTVMAIRRDHEWTVGPDGDSEIAAGDVLIARGPRTGEKRLRALAGA